MLKPFTRYEPDGRRPPARAGPRIVIAVGATSRTRRSPAAPRVALAERLGSAAVRFPGDHGGFMADPAGFAAAIRQVPTADAG